MYFPVRCRRIGHCTRTFWLPHSVPVTPTVVLYFKLVKLGSKNVSRMITEKLSISYTCFGLSLLSISFERKFFRKSLMATEFSSRCGIIQLYAEMLGCQPVFGWQSNADGAMNVSCRMTECKLLSWLHLRLLHFNDSRNKNLILVNSIEHKCQYNWRITWRIQIFKLFRIPGTSEPSFDLKMGSMLLLVTCNSTKDFRVSDFGPLGILIPVHLQSLVKKTSDSRGLL